jgi:hypothetical protein
MRLAHLILAHNNPLQLERLVKRLMYKNTDVYIHLDKKSNLADFKHLATLENVFFIVSRTAVVWANYSMVTATVNSFEEILSSGTEYTHVNLLSGMDYPLKSAAAIQEFLFEHADKTFMKFRHIFKEWEASRSRFTMYSFGDYNFPFKFTIQAVLNKLMPARKLPGGLEPYGRSQWFTMTPVCIRYVLDYLKGHPEAKRFFRMTWGVDELIFQTILLNSNLKDSIVNDHLRYIRFDKGGSRPHTLTMADKQVLLDSDKFYARKFDPETDTEILDYLDLIAEYKPDQ